MLGASDLLFFQAIKQAIKILHDDETLKKRFYVLGNLSYDRWKNGTVPMENGLSTQSQFTSFVVLQVPKHLRRFKELVFELDDMEMRKQYSDYRIFLQSSTAFVQTVLIQLFGRMVASGVWVGPKA